MARNAGIISLIFILLIQTLSTTLILTGFELNRETITEFFCVNKGEPQMHCDGNCFLEKQLETDKKAHQTDTRTLPDFIQLVFPIAGQINFSCSPGVSFISPALFGYLIGESVDVPSGIFHPPRY